MSEPDVDQASVSGTINKGFVEIPLGQLENQSFDETTYKTGKNNSYFFFSATISDYLFISITKIHFLSSFDFFFLH